MPIRSASRALLLYLYVSNHCLSRAVGELLFEQTALTSLLSHESSLSLDLS
jgi:hypothetical protein